MRVVHTDETSPEEIAKAIGGSFGDTPKDVVLFYAPSHSGAEVAERLRRRWPTANIVGCSTAGELSTGRIASGTVVAACLDGALVKRSAVALADYGGGVPEGLEGALSRLETTFGPLRELDPTTHVGLVFIDSTHAVEEETHELLGNAAPLLSFVGGSAGDDLAFERTEVLAGDRATSHGCALMVLEVSRPFTISKTCHFRPKSGPYTVTRADGRWLLELDGRPASTVYAEHAGCAPEELDFDRLFTKPIGMVIDGEPWLRQITPPTQEGGAVRLGCSIAEGAVVHFMEPATPLTANLEDEIARVKRELGTIRGALLFDCALRRLELDATGTRDAYAAQLAIPCAGYHTHGESWLGHMHQTLTGLFFG